MVRDGPVGKATVSVNALLKDVSQSYLDLIVSLILTFTNTGSWLWIGRQGLCIRCSSKFSLITKLTEASDPIKPPEGTGAEVPVYSRV
jgi:hypothetical protein